MATVADRVDGRIPFAPYDHAGVCPHGAITELAGLVHRCRTWWEQGQLGMTLMSTPLWLIEAMEHYGVALHEAMNWQVRQDQEKHGPRK